jgi:hypothetical protein
METCDGDIGDQLVSDTVVHISNSRLLATFADLFGLACCTLHSQTLSTYEKIWVFHQRFLDMQTKETFTNQPSVIYLYYFYSDFIVCAQYCQYIFAHY